MSDENQIILCESCGSKWLIPASKKASIIARLLECPLCTKEETMET